MTAPPTTLGFALLGLLHQAPQSGYDLRKVFASTALGNYSSSPGAIYPALTRLERAGLVESRLDRGRPLRPRTVYRPTRAGTAALRGWLTRPVTREDVERRMEDLMLRFAFHAVLQDTGQTLRFLETLGRYVDECLTELRRQRVRQPAQSAPHARLALEAGIEQYLACARWTRKALRHFTEGPS